VSDINGFLVGVAAVLTPASAALAGVTAARRSKAATAKADKVAEEKREDERDDKYAGSLRADLDALKADALAEKVDRRRIEAQLWVALNTYRVRDAAWWKLFHALNKRIVDLGGEPIPLPDVLSAWPEMPPAPA
jgi:hypothetical protein